MGLVNFVKVWGVLVFVFLVFGVFLWGVVVVLFGAFFVSFF